MKSQTRGGKTLGQISAPDPHCAPCPKHVPNLDPVFWAVVKLCHVKTGIEKTQVHITCFLHLTL